jgi:hypothetical protein
MFIHILKYINIFLMLYTKCARTFLYVLQCAATKKSLRTPGVGLRVPSRFIKEISLFDVCSSGKNCPSARCASAANAVCRDADVFGTKTVSLSHIP